jgi:hypothetical protein
VILLEKGRQRLAGDHPGFREAEGPSGGLAREGRRRTGREEQQDGILLVTRKEPASDRGVRRYGVIMGSLLLGLALACPDAPTLRDADAEVTALNQNLKFIATGARRSERAALLGEWLDGEGEHVDMLLLSEARILSPLLAALSSWCFYNQSGEGLAETYRWGPLGERPPGGLVLGVRTRERGELRSLEEGAGRRFRALPATFSEGFLGRIFGYHKGWANLVVDGTTVAWSHTQASYESRPERGAGGNRRGRAGQFDDLASDLEEASGPWHIPRPTLLTGDLNLLDLFDGPNAKEAREIDRRTVRRFSERTGIQFAWGDRTFFGSLFRGGEEGIWDRGAQYDRVGINEAFQRRHPGLRVRRVEIARAGLRVSDHAAVEITIPFRKG